MFPPHALLPGPVLGWGVVAAIMLFFVIKAWLDK